MATFPERKNSILIQLTMNASRHLKPLLVLLLFGTIAGCSKPPEDKPTLNPGIKEEVVGIWRSTNSNLEIRDDGTFRFTPAFLEDKPRGSGIWEASKSLGYYLRYGTLPREGAPDPEDFRAHRCEYFRIINSQIVFHYYDHHEHFSRVDSIEKKNRESHGPTEFEVAQPVTVPAERQRSIDANATVCSQVWNRKTEEWEYYIRFSDSPICQLLKGDVLKTRGIAQ